MIVLQVFFLLLAVLDLARGNAIDALDDCDDSLNEMDRAKVTFPANAAAAGYTVYAINEDCYRCAKTFVATIQSDSESCVSMWTPFKWKFYLNDVNGAEVEVDHLFGDHGEYNAVIPAGVLTLSFSETRAPIDSNAPLYVLLGILGAIAAVSFGIPLLRDAYRDRSSFYTASPPPTSHTLTSFPAASHPDWSKQSVERISEPPPRPPSRPKPARLRSLDTFRGFSLLMMIFVNYGGGGYWFFDHAAWNGLTFADLLFPWFMWIMGVSMALSFSHVLPPLSPDLSVMDVYALPAFRKVVYQVCVRSLKLFFLGMFLANGADYTTWRIPGVLQYFAASYFFVAMTILAVYPITQRLVEAQSRSAPYSLLPRHDPSTPPSAMDTDSPPPRDGEAQEGHPPTQASWLTRTLSVPHWQRLTVYRYEILPPLALLVVYLLTVFLAQAPGCPRGYNGPGGIGDDGEHPECTGGIHRYLDIMLFTHKMIFHRPTCLELYQCRAYDPEGLLGVCTACVLTYLGLLTGRVFLHYPKPSQNLKLLAYQAIILLFLCGVLCNFSQNEGVIPVNKNLWSVSFICVCGGLGIVGLIICYLLVDVYKIWTGAPLVYLGMNSILIYAAHGLVAGYFPFSFIVFDNTHAIHLTSNAVGVLACVLIAWYWYRIKFFVKV